MHFIYSILIDLHNQQVDSYVKNLLYMLIIVNSSEGSICVCKRSFSNQIRPDLGNTKTTVLLEICSGERPLRALYVMVILTQLFVRQHYACDHASAFSVGVWKACTTHQHLTSSPSGKQPVQCCIHIVKPALRLFSNFNIRINKISPLYPADHFVKLTQHPFLFVRIGPPIVPSP